MNVRIEEFSETDERWDRLIDVSPQSTIFHNMDWLRIMEKYTNTKLVLLAGLDSDEIFTLVPFFYEERFGGLLRKLTSPPYPTGVQYLGLVFPNSHKWKQSKLEHNVERAGEELNRYIRSKIKPNSIFISTSPDLVDIRPFLQSGYNVVPRYTYIGDIGDTKLVWKKFNTTTRKRIRKAEKSGVVVEEGGDSEYNFIIDSLVKRYEEQGMKFDLSKNYLGEVYHVFHPDNLRVFVCKLNGECIGGQVVLVFKTKFYFWFGGVRPEMNEENANYLLFWKLIEWGQSKGLEYLDLVGANNPSISRFKSQFGFDLKAYFWMQKSTLRYKLALNAIRVRDL